MTLPGGYCRTSVRLFVYALGAILLSVHPCLSATVPTLFTYQGNLKDGGSPANGIYDLTLSLYDSLSAGAQVGNAATNTTVAVTNGLFSVSVDFGASAFNGQARWMEIAVRKDTNSPYTVLAPRQPVTAAPYALSAGNLTSPLSPDLLPSNVPRLDGSQLFSGSNIFAGVATLTNTANLFAGAFSGDASALTNLNSSALRRTLATPSPLFGTNFIVDFLSDAVQITATTNINLLQSTNRPTAPAYVECVWYIQGGAANRLLTVNPNWTPIGTLATNTPFVLLSNKVVILAFSARGAGETNVVYAIARQE